MTEGNIPLAVVTGAAQRIGRVIASALAGAGYAIGLHYNASERESIDAAAEIHEQFAMPVYRLRADLTKPGEIDAMFSEIAALPHPLRVLINSASIMPHVPMREMDPETWDSVMALNVRAPWLCARAAEPLMQSGGCIINLSDSGAARAWTGYPAYVISKGALDHLTRLMARAYAPAVRVNAIAPGLMLPGAEMSAAQWDRLVERLPLQQAGQPRDVADAALFLIRSPYITGQTLVVDGGYQLI